MTTGSLPSGSSKAPDMSPYSRREGVIYRSDHMPPEREAERFYLADDGLPTGYLAHRAGQLVILADGEPEEIVNPRSSRTHRLGLYSFRVRGVTHHAAAVAAGNFSPGATVRLVREPNNEHDSNAIAVYAQHGIRPAGYVNRQNAARLAKRIDAGDELANVVLRGGSAGDESTAPVILVASPAVIAHLRRNL